MNNNQLNGLVNKLLPVLLERDQLRAYLTVPSYCKEVFNIAYSDGQYIANKLKQLNLAYFLRPDGNMRITSFGREIATNGGWTLHVERQHAIQLLKENEKQLEVNEAKLDKAKAEHEKAQERLIAMQERVQKAAFEEYQLKLNEINIKIARKSANASWFAGSIALLALLFSLYQGYTANTQNEDINTLKAQVLRLDSTLKSHQSEQTILNKSNPKTPVISSSSK